MTQPDNRRGYQPPAKPAAVSGPGKYSQRTDGQPIAELPDAAYGEQATFRQAQQAGPMAQAGQPGQAPTVSPLDMSRITPLDAPSMFPEEPVTAGADAGPGPGASVLGLPTSDPSMQYAKELLPALEIAASMPHQTVEFRQMVRRLRAS